MTPRDTKHCHSLTRDLRFKRPAPIKRASLLLTPIATRRTPPAEQLLCALETAPRRQVAVSSKARKLWRAKAGPMPSENEIAKLHKNVLPREAHAKLSNMHHAGHGRSCLQGSRGVGNRVQIRLSNQWRRPMDSPNPTSRYLGIVVASYRHTGSMVAMPFVATGTCQRETCSYLQSSLAFCPSSSMVHLSVRRVGDRPRVTRKGLSYCRGMGLTLIHSGLHPSRQDCAHRNSAHPASSQKPPSCGPTSLTVQ
jgi:hypothetical protein